MAGQQQRQAPHAQGGLPNVPYLTDNQQDLLLAALSSQAKDRQNAAISRPGSTGVNKRTTSDSQPGSMSGSALFMSPQDAELNNFDADYEPDLDYLDGDNSFDFDNADLGGEMIGALPGDSQDDLNGHGDSHEKRKSPDEKDDDEEGDSKRQETQDGEKSAKKPGRKPLTNEPTTKRKAQNRAAQRAFRERKEKHLKDLETKVTELTKTQEADKHENGLLKAQVERLQSELRDYRKRLSLNNGPGGLRGSPPLNAYTGPVRSNSGGPSYGGGFQFDFPKFGALPGSQIFGNTEPTQQSNTTTTPPPPAIPCDPNTSGGVSGLPGLIPTQVQRQDSQNSARSMSPRNATPTRNNSQTSTPQTSGNAFPSSSASNGVSNFDATNGGESTAGLNRVFQFNSGSSASDSASPSGSSTSQWNAQANSSCGTSPEPSHESPGHKANNSGVETYNDKNDTSRHSSNSLPTYTSEDPHASTSLSNINLTNSNLDFSIPSNTTFDPVLFNDYRDPTLDPTFGGTDFSNGGFFDDTFNTTAPFDYGSPSNLFGILQSPQQSSATLGSTVTPSVNNANNAPMSSANLMAQMDKARDGGDDDYGLPGSGMQPQAQQQQQKTKLISCNNIWNQLQSNPSFQNGTFDLDSLCSELRAKARCSESGVMVSQDHVDAALKKLGKKDESSGRFMPNMDAGTGGVVEAPSLMFEQESWDKVLRKLGGGGGGGQ
ncbi:hypothetical protein BAUCODRAFT_63784 [Baudoinia panamericana UAMH 10762]|uniref:BZIP domain-containing protein n=1 Tax=Baudoinia panamericana (strain UAMH 10762) TaxID=717646 RepID=M2MRI1_BAUPA|nr:uncharacterized protein BAUCODRAFT_63784 [Baudoinia panamericana UAMH 10762]EMC99441.1 hypothetical protein BAUCODRAFT_63784 [Baudoinia panamericana UAMH 10762]